MGHMENRIETEGLVRRNSPSGDFLQSEQWRAFQESFGRRTHALESAGFRASVIEHALPIVGKYFYVPRGPVFENNGRDAGHGMQELVDLAKKENAGWIRIEPATEALLEAMRGSLKEKTVKAPYDVQPKEIFAVGISKTEEELLSEMKPKTRYNISLAKKKGVSVRISSAGEEKNVQGFLKLTREMAARQGITPHPESYYRKMLEVFPEDMLKLYVAEYAGAIIAANLVLFQGNTATYLHGASGNGHRNVMAPFLLQWRAILDAKERGCARYDFGGVQTAGVSHKAHSDLSGVSSFKLGFSPLTKSVVFPGTYDIIVNPRSYALYKGLQKAKMLVRNFRR